MTRTYLIDDFRTPWQASSGRHWRYVSDRVMGGVSEGRADYAKLGGRSALRLSGQVSLENNGGFIQLALDLHDDAEPFDASAFDGVEIMQCGDGGRYAINLRSSDVRRPWESYRAPFTSTREWQALRLPFAGFRPHRIDRPLAPHKLKRIGVIAIGTAGPVDLAVARLAFYSDAAAA